jgi:3-oxoacyl-[acyl-carrier protein] reductase
MCEGRRGHHVAIRPVDILVNNVGKASGTDVVATTDADWQSAIDPTLFPPFACHGSPCRKCAARAAAVILMIASIWGRESGGRMTYNAVKAAEISPRQGHVSSSLQRTTFA